MMKAKTSTPKPTFDPTIDATFFHYLPVPEYLFHSGIYVTAAGRRVAGPDEPYKVDLYPQLYQLNWNQGRILPEFGFMLVTSGRGEFESKHTGLIPITAGTGIFLFPDVWHRYRPKTETGWKMSWVTFSGEFPHLLLQQNFLSPLSPVIKPASVRGVEAAFHQLLICADENATSNSMLCSLHAMSLLAAVLGTSAPHDVNVNKATNKLAQAPLVEAAFNYIWTLSHHVISVSDVARAVGANRRTLERQFQATRGHSLLDEINQCRFARAERLIRETDLPIKSVVALSGFGSAESMRRVFVERTRKAPGDYRGHHQSLRPNIKPEFG